MTFDEWVIDAGLEDTILLIDGLSVDCLLKEILQEEIDYHWQIYTQVQFLQKVINEA